MSAACSAAPARPACHPEAMRVVVPAMKHGLEAALALALWVAMPAHGAGAALIVQSSPLAGSQFYRGRELWQALKVGDALELVREPGNAHDPNAVRVLWRG